MKMVGMMLLVVGMSVAAIGQGPLAPPGGGQVPEIDFGSGVSALTLLSGTLLVIKSRRKK